LIALQREDKGRELEIIALGKRGKEKGVEEKGGD
jgi:hypothetical protein